MSANRKMGIIPRTVTNIRGITGINNITKDTGENIVDILINKRTHLENMNVADLKNTKVFVQSTGRITSMFKSNGF